jgi:hypothetical protein
MQCSSLLREPIAHHAPARQILMSQHCTFMLLWLESSTASLGKLVRHSGKYCREFLPTYKASRPVRRQISSGRHVSAFDSCARMCAACMSVGKPSLTLSSVYLEAKARKSRVQDCVNVIGQLLCPQASSLQTCDTCYQTQRSFLVVSFFPRGNNMLQLALKKVEQTACIRTSRLHERKAELATTTRYSSGVPFVSLLTVRFLSTSASD